MTFAVARAYSFSHLANLVDYSAAPSNRFRMCLVLLRRISRAEKRFVELSSSTSNRIKPPPGGQKSDTLQPL